VSLRIEVRMENIHSSAPPPLRVIISNERISFHAETFTDDTGTARFNSVPSGYYRMRLTGRH